jgi:hypothetical protein
VIALILSALLTTGSAMTELSTLPIFYGPTVSMHVGTKASAPWRITTKRAVNETRFDWSLDIERRQQRAQIGNLAMAYERSRRRVAGNGFATRPQRSAAWQANAVYRLAGLDGHPLALQAKGGAERRIPIAANGRGRPQLIRGREIDLTWYPTGSLTVAGGWQSIGSTARGRAIDRLIDIAWGNPISEAGPKLQLGLDSKTTSLTQPVWHIGLDAGAYRIASRDMAVLGSPNPVDERITMSLRVAFR